MSTSPALQSTRNLRVLFVEDSPDDAALLLRVLERAGYEIYHERVDTAEAMRMALTSGSWDIVLADYSMPRFSAPRALEVLQTTGSNVPMIVVSGSVGEETAVAVMKQGAADYIMKDCLARLVPAVEREIRESLVRKAREHSEARFLRQVEHLAALRAVDSAIGQGLDLNETLGVILDQVMGQLNADAAAVLLLDPARELLYFAAGRGFQYPAIALTQVRLGSEIAGRAALEKRRVPEHGLLEFGDASASLFPDAMAQLFRQEGISSYAVEPLVAKNSVKGVIEIFMRRPFEPDEDWLHLLEALAAQAAIAVDNASMVDQLQATNRELIQAYDTTLEGWSRALDLRDHETEGHTRRVTDLTLRLAARLGMPEQDLVHIRRGALLHDIGKMGIPDSILLKPGALTPEEWEIMRKHPVYAWELLTPIAFLGSAIDIPYCHHERWDGTGYPRGLRGEEIPLSARIFAVADVYDALRSDRPYRKGWSEEATIQHIRANVGSHFDPAVALEFLRMVEEQDK